MSVVVQIAFGPVSVWLVSGYSSRGDLQDGWGQPANSSMRKNGCLGDVLGQDH